MRRVLGSVSREQQVVRRTGAVVRSYTTAAASASAVSGRKWDAIVVGGGHNGLVTAAYLAKVPFHSFKLINGWNVKDLNLLMDGRLGKRWRCWSGGTSWAGRR